MYKDFNLEEFDLITIKEIIDDNEEIETYDIEVEEKHYFQVKNPHNEINESIISHNSAEIAIGDPSDEEFLNLKNYKINPERATYGWTSNNSIYATLGMNYSDVADRTWHNGEPGYIWLENIRGYSRIKNGKDNKDHRAEGVNPCCFHGDTKIALADGRCSMKIKDLAELGDDIPVYSLNTKTNDIEIKWARVPQKTRKNAELVKITFDNGKYLIVTPDHKIPLLNGQYSEAKDLQIGDSIPRFGKEFYRIKNQKYIRVNQDVLNPKIRKSEHRLIAEFFNKEKYDKMYNIEKNNGWCNGGVVIHHIDYNGLNNDPNNLQIMTFSEHSKFHGERDNIGEKNPMYGKKQKKFTKKIIGKKSKRNWDNQRYFMIQSIQKGMTNDVKKHISKKKKENWLDYYIEQENNNLDTIWVGDRLYAVKKCETCGSEMILGWKDRNTSYCSRVCVNKAKAHIEKRVEGQTKFFNNQQMELNHKRIGIYSKLKKSLNRNPLLREFIEKLKDNNISFRLNKYSQNPYIFSTYKDFQNYVNQYNHKVISIDYLDYKEDTYNLTVDDNHTVAILLDENGGIFAFQSEQSLESGELCCLVETFPTMHDNKEDFLRTLKFAYLYAKTVTLGQTHWPDTNRVMLRNRRIGCSMSGIAQFITKHGLEELRKWMESGYETIQKWDAIYSDWFAIPRSIKISSIKPSGTISILAGATPGVHYPESRFYIRRVRVAKNSPLIKPLKKARFHIEDAFGDESSVVVEFPVDIGEGIRTINEISLWEQLSLAAFMQRYWADNQVSCLVGNTYIRTNRGLIQMKDLPSLNNSATNVGIYDCNIPLKVLNKYNQWSDVKKIIIREKSPIYNIEMEGNNKISGTADHEIQILNNDLNIIWKSLKNVQNGDYVVECINQLIDRALTKPLNIEFDYNEKTNSNKKITIPIQMTNELAEFLGYIVSDGFILSNRKTFGLSQTKNNVISRFNYLCKYLFNADVNIQPDKRSKNLFKVTVNSVKISQWLYSLNIYDNNGFKRSPYIIFNSNYSHIKNYIKGLTLDGHFNKDGGRITIITSNSYLLLEEVNQLLKIIGFQSIINKASDMSNRLFPNGKKKYDTKKTWSLSISPDQSSRFFRIIGFAEDRKITEYIQYGSKKRKSLFGVVPDYGIRTRCKNIKVKSKFFKEHFNSICQQQGVALSRETLLQLMDFGVDIPYHLISKRYAFRKVIKQTISENEKTYDISVPNGESYVSNGFISHNCTITLDPEKEGKNIVHALNYFQYQLKGISFLPKTNGGAFPQMPYEEITEEKYNEITKNLKPIDFSEVTGNNAEIDKFCNNDVCELQSEFKDFENERGMISGSIT